MPAYIHHHDAETPFIICPSCVGLPMCVKDVTSDCGAEVRQTVTKADLLN